MSYHAILRDYRLAVNSASSPDRILRGVERVRVGPRIGWVRPGFICSLLILRDERFLHFQLRQDSFTLIPLYLAPKQAAKILLDSALPPD